MDVFEHQVSREPNDGSRDDMQGNGYDEEAHETRDKRAETKTTFYKRDIDNLDVSNRRKRQLKRALRRQEGEDQQEVYSEDRDQRKQQNRGEDRRRTIGSFTSQLELTDAQKERVEHLVMDVLTINSFGSYSADQVILAVINVVAREDGRWIEDEDMFRSYMQTVEIPDMETMKRLRGLVRERLPSK